MKKIYARIFRTPKGEDFQKLMDECRKPVRKPDWLERNEWWVLPGTLVAGSMFWAFLILWLVFKFAI